ncbi:GntR family transcriptional regulator [Nonomuraea sp. NPDC050328]|uniref:GntR family transcriptional regulator n=1 Tax=Nonomuraea sp. NPDC050328 TaxID=3364361 RepID=UPI003791D629
MVDREGDVHLYLQIVAELRERVRELAPGCPVASEAEIRREFGVARATARKAIHVLRAEGLVHTVRGKGAFAGHPGQAPLQHRRVLLYQRIAADIADQIRAGALPPRRPIPSESALTRQYGTARETVRRAMAVLRGSGWIYTVAARGSYVAPSAFWPPDVELDTACDAWTGRRVEALRDSAAASHGLAGAGREREVWNVPAEEGQGAGEGGDQAGGAQHGSTAARSHMADGRIHTADGRIHTADGRIHTAEGGMQSADGRMHSADARVHSAEGRSAPQGARSGAAGVPRVAGICVDGGVHERPGSDQETPAEPPDPVRARLAAALKARKRRRAQWETLS